MRASRNDGTPGEIASAAFEPQSLASQAMTPDDCCRLLPYKRPGIPRVGRRRVSLRQQRS